MNTELGRTFDVEFSGSAHDVIDWLSHVVDGPVDLLGHSLGGRVALRFALARRDLLRSLILMDTTAWRFGLDDPDMAETIIAYFASLTVDSPMGAAPPTLELPLIEAATPTAWQARKAELSAAFDPMAAKAYGSALFGDLLQPIEHLLGDIDVPVTVIAGEHDHPYVEHAPVLADAVVDGRHVVIDGAYHSPQLTHPDAWLAASNSHLDRVQAP